MTAVLVFCGVLTLTLLWVVVLKWWAARGCRRRGHRWTSDADGHGWVCSRCGHNI